jgi:hypothetical protein
VVRTIYRLLRVWGATRAVLPDVRFSGACRFFYTKRIYIRRAEVSLSGAPALSRVD